MTNRAAAAAAILLLLAGCAAEDDGKSVASTGAQLVWVDKGGTEVPLVNTPYGTRLLDESGLLWPFDLTTSAPPLGTPVFTEYFFVATSCGGPAYVQADLVPPPQFIFYAAQIARTRPDDLSPTVINTVSRQGYSTSNVCVAYEDFVYAYDVGELNALAAQTYPDTSGFTPPVHPEFR